MAEILFQSSSLTVSVDKDDDKWVVFVNGEKHPVPPSVSADDDLNFGDGKDEALIYAQRFIYNEQQNEYFKRLLLSENVMVLAGAGSSIVLDKGGSTMKELWKEAEKIGNFENRIESCGLPKEEVSKLSENLESLLSALSSLRNSEELKGKAVKAKEIDDFIKEIEGVIFTKCKFDVDEDFPHENFVRNLLKTRKKSDSRLKIFSLNYDTCFEQVADNMGGIVIDGFNFSSEPEFKSNSFDYDIVQRENNRVFSEHNYVDNVFHLYKLHGSINWKKEGGKIFKKPETKAPFLIYPGNQKFETTYETPFFELLSRFQKSLSSKNNLLLVVGYSFGDKHINQALLEALQSNVNLHVVVLSSRVITEDPKKGVNDGETIRYNLYKKMKKGFKDLTFIGGKTCFADFAKNMPTIDSYSIEEERRNFFKPQDD